MQSKHNDMCVYMHVCVCVGGWVSMCMCVCGGGGVRLIDYEERVALTFNMSKCSYM